jgi:hypothetical protein
MMKFIIILLLLDGIHSFSCLAHIHIYPVTCMHACLLAYLLDYCLLECLLITYYLIDCLMSECVLDCCTELLA